MPINMLFTPAHDYPTNYDQSVSEIELKCPCHPGWISGYAKRVGMSPLKEEYPVYKIFGSRHHPHLIDQRVTLTPTGFVSAINVITTARIRKVRA